MVIVKIVGGLGNQMFQYAYAKALEQKGYKVKIDILAFETYKLHGGYQLNFYNIDLEISTKEENNKFHKNNIFFKVLRRIGFNLSKRIKEKSLLFDNKLLKIEDDNYIEGYFQCDKYFLDIKEILSNQFIINQKISMYSKNIENKIKDSENSCSLHIRRGDYVNDSNISIHGVCDIGYYKDSIQFLKEKIGSINFFIFSDDIDWVKENLELENSIYVESKEKRLVHEDIYLMSLCNHNIIANSSFSWWGAWLNQNVDKIVIAPKKWFADDELNKCSKDIVCKTWIKK